MSERLWSFISILVLSSIYKLTYIIKIIIIIIIIIISNNTIMQNIKIYNNTETITAMLIKL